MLRRLVAVAALGLVLPVGAPIVAHAQGLNSVTVVDERGDVWKLREEEPPVSAPQQRRGDFRRATIRHRAHTITVRAKFSEIARQPQFHALVVRLRTNTGARREISLIGGQFGRRSFWRGFVEVARPNGRPVNCETAHRIDYTNNVMRVRIPRSCLNEPRWVQANVLSLGVFGRQAQAASYFDTAHGPQRRITDWTQRLHRP